MYMPSGKSTNCGKSRNNDVGLNHMGQLTFSLKRRDSEPSQGAVVLPCLMRLNYINMHMYIRTHACAHTHTHTHTRCSG